jgi:hypothetical protein
MPTNPCQSRSGSPYRGLTSPRLRGEVELLLAMRSIVQCNSGEGDSPRVQSGDRAPHPNPLPASGRKRGEGENTPSPSRGADSARVMQEPCPSNERGRREDRASDAPAASYVKIENIRVSTPQVHRINPAFPAQMVLTAYFVLSSVSRALLPPSQATMRKHCRQLDISVGISGPHDFAVRGQHHSSVDEAHVHRIPRSTSVTIAKRPS